MDSYILIPDSPDTYAAYPVDSYEQVCEAEDALVEAGLVSAKVWYGHPDSPDSYVGNQILFAPAQGAKENDAHTK
jgi:hypothetical protein